MWQHQAGRIDFNEPLLQLMQRGWAFREYGPLAGALDGGSWVVIGVEGIDWIKVDRFERRDAWAEAVRLALIPAVERWPRAVAACSGTTGSSPDDPTVRDEERARLRAMGWSFTEHLTAQQDGTDGWVVDANWRGRRIRIEQEDRADAWGTVLILAAETSVAESGGPPRRPGCRPSRLRRCGARGSRARMISPSDTEVDPR
jgi:hypothetical protein